MAETRQWQFMSYPENPASLSRCQVPIANMEYHGLDNTEALLIQGAQSALMVIDKKSDPRSQWLQNLCGRRHKNVAAVALANKNARIAWALLNNETNYISEGKPA